MIMSVRRRFAVFALVLVAAGGGVAAQMPASQAPAETLTAVRARFAPDKRLAVFDVSVDNGPDGTVVSGEVESIAARDAALAAVKGRGPGRIIDRLRVLPDPALGAQTHGIVRVSVANVRSKPAHAAELVTQTLMGWPVRVLKEQSGWFLVHTEPDGYLGWIEDLQLTRATAEDRHNWETSTRLIALVPHTILRQAPSVTSEPVADLVIGSLVRSAGESNSWAEVLLPDGRRGFVPASDVQDYQRWKEMSAPIAESVSDTARQFMGVPYLWGGTSANGFDCSGFAKTVLFLNGIHLPRDTDQQAEVGEPVVIDTRLTHLKKGDLLFFGTAATADRPERISHVGIHVGDLEFIHASGLVRRNSLDPASPIYSESLRRRLLRVRRVLPPRNMTSEFGMGRAIIG